MSPTKPGSPLQVLPQVLSCKQLFWSNLPLTVLSSNQLFWSSLLLTLIWLRWPNFPQLLKCLAKTPFFWRTFSSNILSTFLSESPLHYSFTLYYTFFPVNLIDAFSLFFNSFPVFSFSSFHQFFLKFLTSLPQSRLFFYLHCFLFAFGTLFFARPPNRCFFFDLRFFPYDFLLLHFFFDLIVFPAYAFSLVFLLMAFIYFFLFSLFPCWLCFYDCYLASTT